jgi:(2Fe-2S) ferredoxin
MASEGEDSLQGIRITVGMGTCGIAAGAREVMHAILDELESRGIRAHINAEGCAGACAREPMVRVEVPELGTVTYANVRAAAVPRLVEEHLVHRRPVAEWIIPE